MNGWTPFLSWWHHTIYYCCLVFKFQSFCVTSRYKISKHVFLGMPHLSNFGSLYGSTLLLVLADDVLESFLSIKVIEVLLLGIGITCDGIISSYYNEWFHCALPSFPFNVNIMLASFQLGPVAFGGPL